MINTNEETNKINKVIKKKGRSKMMITKCNHKEMKHYAKGLCKPCYHSIERNTYADNCAHND